jgi:plasmid stability protein
MSSKDTSTMIQVRNVPGGVHRTLKARAAAAGMSLSDYIKRDLIAAAAAPSLEEIDARVQARGPSRVRAQSILAALREVRDG